MVSSAACLYPEFFTDAGFLKEGWKYALGFGLVCLGISGIGGFHGIENPYILHHDEHEGGRYQIFPLLDDEDQHGSANPGLRSLYVTYN